MKNIVENQYIKTDKPLAMSYEALKAERDALADRVNALAVSCSLYREVISKARRLINVDEMGDADDVLAQAERELSSHDAALAVIQAQAKAEAIEQLAIQLEQLPDEALEFLSDVAEFETYQEEHHTFVSISNPRAVANAVLSLVKEQSTDPREAK